MHVQLAPLPYAYNALEPVLSEYTVRAHHDRHEAGYVRTLNRIMKNEPDFVSLEQVMAAYEPGTPAYDNAAQIWNHEFYWGSMLPAAGPRPAYPTDLGLPWPNLSSFVENWAHAAKGLFGSGYIWLTWYRNGFWIDIMANADNPMRYGAVPLLCTDLWEHSYWNDYINDRETYARQVAQSLINWHQVHRLLMEP